MVDCRITTFSDLGKFEPINGWDMFTLKKAMLKGGYNFVCNNNRLVLITPASHHITVGRAME